MPLRPTTLLTVAPLALASVLAAVPRTASACGGTFCDAGGGPQVMPVDQSGESILFVMGEGFVEAHVQIEYQGDPAQFAWIVPLMLPPGTEPEISPGSDALFQRLLAATVPTFTLDTAFEGDCSQGPRGGGLGCGMRSDTLQAGGGDDFIDDSPPPSGSPTVLARDVAGAYEYAVLAGGTVDGIGQWLDDNGYARDDDAPSILQAYLDEGFSFVAFKLRAGTGLDQIHPVVLRYQGTEPCVPLRLTRIAAIDDMPVRAFFLGHARVVPTNYRHVELNPLRIDWLQLASNYEALVSEAVDVDGASGRAFLTEYAGPSSVVPLPGLSGLRWKSQDYLEITAGGLSYTLEEQGLYECSFDESGEGCGFTHPLILGLLRTYFPPPPDVSPAEFFACTHCYGEVDDAEWDRTGFAAAFEEQIAAPAAHAATILLQNRYLTRLYTVISPGEMTSDPLFHERPDLPPVSNEWRATRVFHCEENDRIDLPDGTSIYLDEDGLPPDFTAMSAAVRVAEVPLAGASMMLLDTADDDAAELAAWNAVQNPRAGCECQASRRHLQGAGWLGLLLLLGLRGRGPLDAIKRRERPRRSK
jgi:hypothetical protein